MQILLTASCLLFLESEHQAPPVTGESVYTNIPTSFCTIPHLYFDNEKTFSEVNTKNGTSHITSLADSVLVTRARHCESR